MINELLIPGQVENYVLILNLEGFSIGMKDVRIKLCRQLWKLFSLLAILIEEGFFQAICSACPDY